MPNETRTQAQIKAEELKVLLGKFSTTDFRQTKGLCNGGAAAEAASNGYLLARNGPQKPGHLKNPSFFLEYQLTPVGAAKLAELLRVA